jgi:hypothetical protein
MSGTSSISKAFIEGVVWEQVATFVFASGDTAEVKQKIPINGVLQKIIAKRSGASGAVVTAIVAIDDNGDNEIFTVAGLAESGTTSYNVTEPVTGAMTVGVTPSTNPLSAYTVTVTLRGIR